MTQQTEYKRKARMEKLEEGIERDGRFLVRSSPYGFPCGETMVK